MSTECTFKVEHLERLDAREAARKALMMSGEAAKGATTVLCDEGPTGWTIIVHDGDEDAPGETLARWRVYRGGSVQKLKT